MAKAKVKASKPPPKKGAAAEATAAGTDNNKRKEPKAKKKGKEWTWGQDDLEVELACIGLRVKQVTGDGNCFFRSLCDQLEGCEKNHIKLRQQVVDHIRDNEEDFKPFVEDDEPFPRYVARMGKDGVWAGYMELIAASNFLQANIHVYQPGQPRWVIGSFNGGRTLHVSYHDGQHYNSVRNAGDHSSGAPPEPIVLKATPQAGKGTGGENGQAWGEKEEQRVSSSSGCHERALIRRALQDAGGDVDAAIEKVIEVLSNRAEEDEAEGEQAEGKQITAADQGGSLADSGASAVTPAGGFVQAATGAGAVADDGQIASGSVAVVQEGQEAQRGASALAGQQGQESLQPSAPEGGEAEDSAAAAPAAADEAAEASVVAAEASQGAAAGHPSTGLSQLKPESAEGPSSQAGADQTVQSAGKDAPPEGKTGSVGVAASPAVDNASNSSSSDDEAHGAAPGKDAEGGTGAKSEHKASSKPAAGKAVKVTSKLSGKKGVRLDKKPSRNKDCPCGSRKKYKNCCGAAAASRRQAAAVGEVKATIPESQVVASASAVAAAAKHLEIWQM